MGYQIHAGVSTGRIDADGLGSFEIEGGQLEVADYDTAAALVSRYGSVEWADADPGRPANSDTGSDADAAQDTSEGSSESDGETEASEDLGDVLQDLTIPEFTEELATGRFDGLLDAVEAAEEAGQDRTGIYDALDNYREE